MSISVTSSTPTTWLSMWANWLIHQYQLENTSQVYDILEQLAQALEQGNSVYMTQDVACFQSACQLQEQFIQSLDTSVKNELFIEQLTQQTPAPLVFDGQALSLYRYWSWEMQLAWQLLRLSQPTGITSSSQLQNLIALLLEKFQLDEHQQNALIASTQHQFSLITGGPGTGKTFTLAQVIAVLVKLNPELRIAMSAPTGKASQRMQEALQKAIDSLPDELKNEKLNQLQPVTLHRLLGMGMQQRAKYHNKNPLPYDVVVIDEASMLDLNLAHVLLNALDQHTRLILLGDAHQLASVDLGSVLADIQKIPQIQPYHQKLVQSRRFDDSSIIGKIAQFMMKNCFSKPVDTHIINDFEQILPPSPQLHMYDDKQHNFAQLCYLDKEIAYQQYYQALMQGYKTYQEKIKHTNLQHMMERCLEADVLSLNDLKQICHIFDDYRILTAIQKGKMGVEQLNQFIEQQFVVHKKQTWYLGKAVMMTYNDYSLGLSNGDIGLCLSENEGQYSVYFPSLERWFLASRLPQNIQPAFALTIHKSQGSEFTHTAVILHDEAERLLSQELIYTAITRAKKQLTLLCTPKSLTQSLIQKTQRHSRLVEKADILIKK